MNALVINCRLKQTHVQQHFTHKSKDLKKEETK